MAPKCLVWFDYVSERLIDHVHRFCSIFRANGNINLVYYVG